MSDLRLWLFNDGWAGIELAKVLIKVWLKIRGDKILSPNFPQHHRRHCHLQRHQNGVLALSFSNMVKKYWKLWMFLHFIKKVWSLHVHHASSLAPTTGLFLCRGQLRRRQSHPGLLIRDIVVVDHLVLSRVSSQLRRGCTCSNTFTATLSRWPYMVTPYPTAQSVFNKCFYTKENVAIINQYKKNYQMICRHSGCGHFGCFCVKDPSPGNRSCLEEPHEI